IVASRRWSKCTARRRPIARNRSRATSLKFSPFMSVQDPPRDERGARDAGVEVDRELARGRHDRAHPATGPIGSEYRENETARGHSGERDGLGRRTGQNRRTARARKLGLAGDLERN